jgi:peptide/nickel transport system permease protein
LLGTDKFGRDILSRLLHGERVSLSIGLLAAGIGFVIGGAVGGIAGLAGGIVDRLLMRFADALLAFPRIFLVFTLSALFEGPSWMVIVVLGGTGWMAASRLVRAEVIRLKTSSWVEASRAVGQSPLKILVRQIFPSVLDTLLVETILRVGEVILLEAALSFLGFGVLPPTPSWGQMIADGSDALTYAWWITVFPGAAITLTVITLNVLGDKITAQPTTQPLSDRRSHVHF